MPSNKISDEIRRQNNKSEAGEVESLNLRKAENGWTVNVYRKAKETKSDEPCCVSNSKDMVFTDKDTLAQFIVDVL